MAKSFINYHTTHFVMSAPNIQYLPAEGGREIAFVGRSNAGKSTALNTLSGQKSLARTSKTPGRTQLINLFQVTKTAFIVDLPGYGYAAVPENVKKVWQRALYDYLQQRSCLHGLVLLMDARHPLKDLDQQMIQWSVQRALPLLLLLTKTDKLSYSMHKKTVEQVRYQVLQFKGDIQVEGFSALKKVGLDKLQQKLDHWFLTP